MRLCLLVLMFFSVVSFTCNAQQDDFSKDILKMQEVNGTNANYDLIYKQIVSQLKVEKLNVSDEIWNSAKSDIYDVETRKLSELLIPVYKKHFTHEEIKELLAFYESPAGKKLAEKTPVIFAESMEISQQWAAGLITRLMEYVESKNY